MRRCLLALPVLAFASLAVVACGDDDDQSSSGGDRAATAVEGDAFCVQAVAVDGVMDGMGAVFGDDPAASEAALTALVAEATKAEALAPADIVDALSRNVQGFRDLAAALEEFDWDINTATADPDVLALLESSELEEASSTVETYLSEKCGIAAN